MTPLRVGIYARVSTVDKDQNPETQLLPLREFAANEGFEVLGEFVDHASANDVKGRKNWARLLTLAEKKKIDLILVWKMDRAWRSLHGAVTTLRNLNEWDVGFRSLTESMVDTSTPQGKLLFNLLASFAEFEREQIAERVKAGMARAKREGRHVGRPRSTVARLMHTSMH